MAELTSTIAGYPRIGRNRELKKALENLWAGKISEERFEADVAQLVRTNLATLSQLGLSGSLPDSSTLYDQVLDTTVLLGATPERFRGKTGLDLYFSLARGDKANPPLEMTKYFDTNYHYLVPEIDAQTPIALTDRRVIERARALINEGINVRPVIVGPATWLALAKGASEGYEPLERLDDAVTAFTDVLGELAQAGVEWVQIDEPALVSGNLATERSAVVAATVRAWNTLGALEAGTRRPKVLLNFPYGDSSAALAQLAHTGVEALGVDLVRGNLPADIDLNGMTLAAGVVNGRNIWRTDLDAARKLLDAARATGARVVVSTSTSLQHVPHSVTDEHWDDPELDAHLHEWLAFADEKVREVEILDRGLRNGWESIENDIAQASQALAQRQQAAGVNNAAIRERVQRLAADRNRADYAERVAAQAALNLPAFPTTTIGSFPQTVDVRKVRAAANRKQISAAEYTAQIQTEVQRVIRLQEDLGLDVLVHGEPERNDMVQYFAEQLAGFSVTTNGWVQSYGSRATRPSILWGDVEREHDMTVDWWTYAQSLTDKPVKGMLTGPVTIIAWSFVREDIPLAQVADQIAVALRDEIDALQEAGAQIVQVDEPALRELLPLEPAKHQQYLAWAVDAFKLSTAGAAPATQIHTHLCYSEFGQIIDAIAALDADVTSIEAARSKMEVLPDLQAHGFSHQIGPGVWDIHSPRVPSVDEVKELLDEAAQVVPNDRLWVNPDCGLKTRDYPETVATLKNLVTAARELRKEKSQTL
ncbi:MAG: 5-methyltetrahydropteroyltriglutamate--homocysteine S-methyltransferase [Actinomycetaceae bacterium]|nr:5-methyltetrahydropteroyltriglutamate--homocysteine S-methyltransferase [Actinomycetaceae bacterium]MDY5855188.1 5-methyltetrahydropteroyltriglutamate--homocysteine S-methyltransferase [Arcanobacterium sp.]